MSSERKRRSSRNAVKSGIYTSAVLINGESPELYRETRLHYVTRFQPADKVEDMATLESASLAHQMDCQQAEIDEDFESIDPATCIAIASAISPSKSENSTTNPIPKMNTEQNVEHLLIR